MSRGYNNTAILVSGKSDFRVFYNGGVTWFSWVKKWVHCAKHPDARLVVTFCMVPICSICQHEHCLEEVA